ncbi:PD-(D/E)XK nuclease family protein [Metallibacterium scheffleri]|uniref:PD-(D/E)XK endonuclease-like domain-containing protein n=1 Tax=Metallibacterium scheffleri TaxID=993689 RepID=A0A4S3KQL7_9GAMM|nr:PD-(D/E)XK nuclease family protein [Metallibacterium scheffleri]THD11322.1 hypothetical protein B1806_04165 [Metallibacterium scheffleri]
MDAIFLSPTATLKYEDCGHQYYLTNVLKIRTAQVGHALPFGKAGHLACLAYIKAQAEGRENLDPVPIFREAWERALATEVIEFSRYSPEELMVIGTNLVKAFPEAWAATGWRALTNANGALVEARMRVTVGDGVVLSGEADMLIEDRDGRIGVPDLKFPAAKAFEGFAMASDQLTAYNILVNAHLASLGLKKRVEWLGFLEGLKKKSVEWTHQTSPARSDAQMEAYLRKLVFLARSIREGHFHKRSAAAFNSPCSLCDMRSLCLSGSADGLVLSDDAKQALGMTPELPMVA